MISEERKKILKLLEDGIITVDEAERLLKALHEHSEKDESTNDQTGEENTALSEFVDWDRWDERKQTYKQNASGFKLSQFIENFIQKIKDVDLDFNFGSYERVKHIYQHHTEHFEEMKINLKNGSVELLPWEYDYVQVDCDAQVYRVANGEEARNKFLQTVRFDIANGTLFFRSDARDIKVRATVHVPQKNYEFIECKLFNGSVTGENVFARELEVKTVNGNVSFANVDLHKGEIESSNGSVTVKGLANRLEVETLNGAIELAGKFRNLEAENFSGTVTADIQAEGNVSFKSAIGNVTVFVPQDVQVNGKLSSALGSVQCELHSFEVLDEKKEMAQRFLHFVTNKKENEILWLEASTKTGAIQVMEREA